MCAGVNSVLAVSTFFFHSDTPGECLVYFHSIPYEAALTFHSPEVEQDAPKSQPCSVPKVFKIII